MLEPEIAAFVARAASLYPEDEAALTIAAQRAAYERLAAAFTPPVPAGVDVRDFTWTTPAGQPIRLRHYGRRAGAAAPATLLFFHGGGFVLGSLDSHALVTAQVAADTGLAVIAVDYRLAPEHPAPAAHDDCFAVTRAALAGELPGVAPAGAVLLAGDSAGGNLAASVALRARDEALSGLKGVALVYPMLGTRPQPPACDTEADAPMLTLAAVRRYSRLYWGEALPPAWTVPIDARRFDGLPPVLAIGVEHDPLRDDARVFAERIAAAGGPVQCWVAPGLVHGCWRALATSPGVQRLHARVCGFLIDAARR
jgi:acetyl esterase